LQTAFLFVKLLACNQILSELCSSLVDRHGMSNDFRTTVSSVGIFAALHPGRLKLWDTIDRVEEAEKSNTANLHTRPYQHNASPSKQGEETSFEHEHDKRHPPSNTRV
jgi:hypothetical protein